MSVEELLRTLSVINPQAIFPSIDTPYAKYSTSNYVASGLDVPAIRDIVFQQREQLDALATILERMNSLVRQLREKREQIACSMKTHEGFVSCIRRLPSDILSEIFMQCLPNTKYAGLGEELLSVPQDCGVHWLSKTPGGSRSIYQHWLENSSRCPLSLKINLDKAFNWRIRQWQTLAVVFSGLYTKRCTDLDILFNSTDDLDLLLGDVPDLESLYLDGPLDTIEWNLSIVQPHPRLHKLIIRSSTFEMDTLSFFNPGWTNLTHLGVLFDEDAAVDHPIFLTLLQMCPNLEHLLFSEILARKVEGPVSLTHAKLRTLEIKRMYEEPGGALFDTLTLPNLRHLRLNDSYSNDFCQPLLNGSGDRALSITFKGDVDELDVDALFKVFQPGWTDLTSITLDTPSSEDIGFLPLQFCPNLDNMVVSFVYVDELDHAPLTHHKLRSLTISVGQGYIGHVLDNLTLPNLRELDLGMKLDIRRAHKEKSDWAHKEFKNFISRSNCQLETLKIKGAAVSGAEREELASLIPTLKLPELHDTREKRAA